MFAYPSVSPGKLGLLAQALFILQAHFGDLVSVEDNRLKLLQAVKIRDQ